MQPLFRIAALILALFVVAACGGDNNSAPTSAASTPQATKASGELLLASTTTTEDSGLLDVLIPAFEDRTGYTVKLISGGSGQALETARRGDADVLLVHSPDAEKKFVADGDGIERAFVMHNDFILVGPPGDPAATKAAADITGALQAIATKGAAFISRGDDSGTHVAELKQWKAAGIDPAGERWYSETGQGQGATMQIASERAAYALTDRGTYLTRKADLDLVIVSEGSPSLLNYYHVIVVNPAKHDKVHVEAARAWAAWVIGPEAQELIRTFGVAEFGEAIFFPDAGKPDPTE